jgi:hypothetical protein
VGRAAITVCSSRSCSKVSCQLGRWFTNKSGPTGSGTKTSAIRVPQAKSAVRDVTLRSGSHTSPSGQRLAIEMPCPSSISPPEDPPLPARSSLLAFEGWPLSSRESRQTFENSVEEPRLEESLVKFLCGGKAHGHPLAVGRDHIFSVSEHPVETATAHDPCSYSESHADRRNPKG